MEAINKSFTLVLGAQKSGTTSLHELISTHSEIACPKIKETHFFSKTDNFKKGVNWYLDQFNLEKDVLCEVDPSYFFYSNCAKRIRNTIQSPKFIIVFRRPIERAFSHYLMSYYKGYENLSFVDALNIESERLLNPDDEISWRHHSYMKRGDYSSQLKQYLTYFDKSNFLFIKFDDLISKNNEEILDSIFNFIGVGKEESLSRIRHSNKSKKIKYKLIRDLLYSDNIIRRAMKKVIPSDLLRIRIKEMINYLNSDTHYRGENISENILNSLPNEYLLWNNNQVERLKETANLDVDDWMY